MSGLTSTDICEILKTAKECGVRHLHFEGLEFVFNDNEPVTPVSSLHPQNSIVFGGDLDDNNVDEPEKIEEPEHIDLDELAISDPVAYEKIIHGDSE